MTEPAQLLVAEPGWGSTYLASDEAPPTVEGLTNFVALQQVINRYAFAFDQRDVATLRQVMTADATWAASVAAQVDYGPFEGIEAIIAFMTTAMKSQTDQRRHVLTNPVLRSCAGGRARFDCYLTLMSAGQGRSSVLTTGFYSMWLRSEGGQWLIERIYLGLDTAE